MSLTDSLQIIDKAIDVLNTADQLVSQRSDGTTTECLVLDLPYVYGLYFGLVGAKKLIDGAPVGTTELEFITIMAANYAIALDAIGAAKFVPYESVKERFEGMGAVQSGDDAS